MQNSKKFLSALLICAILSPAAASAENITKNYEVYGEFEQYDFSLFSDNADIDSAVTYVLDKITESQPDTIDISQFNIPYTQEDFDELSLKIQNSMRFDHPECFYLSYYFNIESNDDYSIFASVVMNEPVNVSDNNGNTTQEMPYTMEKDEIKRRQALIEAETNHILSLIEEDMTPLQKVLIVHDYIAANYSYDWETYYSGQSTSLDNMVINEKGVCQGYAYLFYHVMHRLGIPCINVPSDACGHIWNKVQLDGKWYNIDITHDDPSAMDTDIDYSFGNKRSHFLMSDTELKALAEKDAEKDPLHCSAHTAWNNEDYCPAVDDDYQSSVLRSINSFTVYKDGKFYCFDENSRLCTIDFKNNALVPVHDGVSAARWRVEGGFYFNKFSGLTLYAGRIYFNTPNKIYQFDPKTNTAELYYTYDDKEDTDIANFYGLRTKDGKLYAELSSDPNTEPDLFEIPDPLLSCTIALEASDNNTLKANVSIPSECKDKVSVFIPQYNDKGIFIGFAEPSDDTDGTFRCLDECKTVKAFIWDKETYRPLAQAIPHIF